jgi:protein-disulfide isomerase
VLWVYKHLPLNIHPSAPAAAVAAECAGDQGLFWEMHDLLFASVEQWSGEDVDTDTELLAIAAELPLDDALFESCFASREALERVLDDMSDARGIIAQAPSFVVIQGERGALMEGSLPADQFVASLQGRLDGPEEEG